MTRRYPTRKQQAGAVGSGAGGAGQLGPHGAGGADGTFRHLAWDNSAVLEVAVLLSGEVLAGQLPPPLLLKPPDNLLVKPGGALTSNNTESTECGRSCFGSCGMIEPFGQAWRGWCKRGSV